VSTFPPPERKGPPKGRGPAAAFALPFFFQDAGRELATRARAFCDRRLIDEAEPEKSEAVLADSRRIVAELAGGGLLDLAVPAKLGASALSKLALAQAREEVAYASGPADAILAVQGLGSYPVALRGASELEPLLGRGRDGQEVFAFALTEPDAGSDLSRIATRARRDGDDYVLDGVKTFISNAGIATQYTVFARTAEGKHGITAFLVPASALRVEPLELNAAHPVGTVILEGARVPVSRRLGDEGTGLALALETLDAFRPTVGAAAVGLARRALDEALERIEARVQFKAPLADNAQVQALLADAWTDVEASRLLVYRAAWLADNQAGRTTLEASMSKLHATETAQRAIDLAVQLSGGLGVVRGRVVERLYREVRALRIYEGASEVQRAVIARELRNRAKGP
jgi:acyl-CoA dehydrogenase